MLVKCWDIDEKRERDECYKAPNGKYYTCQEAYDTMVENHKFHDKCVDLYRDWIGRGDKSKPSAWCKKMQLCETYGNKVIYVAMKLADKNARYAVDNKDFKSEYQAAAYLWTIVDGKIFEARRLIEQKERREQQAKMREETYEYEDVDVKAKHRSGAIDISRFVE